MLEDDFEAVRPLQVGDVIEAAVTGERHLAIGEVCELFEDSGRQMTLRRLLDRADMRRRELGRR